MRELETTIEQAFDDRASGFDDKQAVAAAVNEAIALLDTGRYRVAERRDGGTPISG